MCIAWLVAILTADARSAEAEGFVKIDHTSSQDFVSYSPDASKVAIVHTKFFSENPPIGLSLIIYRVDASLQPVQVLFEDRTPGQFITELQWVADRLFYLTIKDVSSSEISPLEWLSRLGFESGWQGVSRHLGVKTWASRGGKVTADLSGIRSAPPGALFSSPGSSICLVFDPLSHYLQYWNDKEQRFSDAVLFNRVVQVYDASGRLIRSVRLKLGRLADRWWGGRGRCVPLYLSKGGKLVALVSSNRSWDDAADNDQPAVVAVDLQTGKITRVTPEGKLNRLRLSRSSVPQYFAPPNPTGINGGEAVACQLTLGESSATLAFRFAFFNLLGTQTQEVLIWAQDLSHAGVSDGLILTWTPDGSGVLIQDQDVWVMDWKNRLAKRAARSVKIDAVFNRSGRIGRPRAYQESTIIQPTYNSGKRGGLDGDKVWGLISLP